MEIIHPEELYQRVRRLWPANVSTEQQELNAIYWPLDDALAGDDWLAIGAWSFHQSLWNLAKDARRRELGSIATSSVSVEDFDKRVRDNLANESWASVRHLYSFLNPKS